MKTLLLTILSLIVAQSAASMLSADASAKKRVVVNLRRQKLAAFEGDIRTLETDCITGGAGKETTPGEFHVTKKSEDYVSNTYKVPMPYSMFFTEDMKAIHYTQLAQLRSYAKYLGAGEPGSHGCVGVNMEDAQALYKWGELKMSIVVIEGTLDGHWAAKDDAREFGLDIDGDVGTLIETRPGAGALTRVSRLERQGAAETFRIQRANDDAALKFLGFADPALRKAILLQNPEPSFLTVSRTVDKAGAGVVSAIWSGLLVTKNQNGSLKQVVQPTKVAGKRYDFSGGR